jgi:MOSC domain-containing protein YiiM
MTAHISGLFTSKGGVPKLPVLQARVDRTGMLGDAVKHTKIHGGPLRALCLFSADVLEALQREGHPVEPGMIGENVLVRGLDWAVDMTIGARWQLGGTLMIEVTDFTEPCKSIAGAFAAGKFRRAKQALYPGSSRVYARVLIPGDIAVGDAVLAAKA